MTVCPHHLRHESWTLVLSHRRQLCPVADKHHAAVASRLHISHEVVEKASASKSSIAISLIGYHGSLVDNEKSVGMKIVVERESIHTDSPRPLSVDAAMDSVGGLPGIQREHLCRPSGGSHQYNLLFHLHHRLHYCRCKGGLASSSRTVEYEHRMVVIAASHIVGKEPYRRLLFHRGREAHLLVYVFDIIIPYHS